MSEGKRLSKEAIESIRKDFEGSREWARVGALLAHISEVETELESARKERDAYDAERNAAAQEMEIMRSWVWGGAVLAQASVEDSGRVTRAAMQGMDEREDRIAKVEQERDEALALLKPSGQVAEDARALELTIDAACEDAVFEAKFSASDRGALSRLVAQAQGYEAFAAACREALGPHRSTGTPADVAMLHKDREAARAFSVQFGQERDAAVARASALRDELSAYVHVAIEAAQILAGESGLLGEGVVNGARRVVAERDAAVADNAALLNALTPVASQARAVFEVHHAPSHCALGLNLKVYHGEALVDLLERAHPGAALLEEVATLRAFAATAHGPEAWESLKKQHRTALVRARNEGLEKAAALADGRKASHLHNRTPCGPCTEDYVLAGLIRAMKEPES